MSQRNVQLARQLVLLAQQLEMQPVDTAEFISKIMMLSDDPQFNEVCEKVPALVEDTLSMLRKMTSGEKVSFDAIVKARKELDKEFMALLKPIFDMEDKHGWTFENIKSSKSFTGNKVLIFSLHELSKFLKFIFGTIDYVNKFFNKKNYAGSVKEHMQGALNLLSRGNAGFQSSKKKFFDAAQKTM